MTVVADAFDELQQRLGEALHANRAGSGIDHVMIVLPSFSIGESTLAHYAARIPSLEHRYLNALLLAGRITDCHVVYISSRAPDPAIVDYYVSLMPAAVRDSLRSRLTLVDIDDGTVRSVASKLLDHPDRIEEIRRIIGGRPALIEGWNVTEKEVRLALALGVPINGTHPRLRHLGFKSDGRRLDPSAPAFPSRRAPRTSAPPTT